MQQIRVQKRPEHLLDGGGNLMVEDEKFFVGNLSDAHRTLRDGR